MLVCTSICRWLALLPKLSARDLYQLARRRHLGQSLAPPVVLPETGDPPKRACVPACLAYALKQAILPSSAHCSFSTLTAHTSHDSIVPLTSAALASISG
ncbi:hypothetical protein J3F84DRAFT_356756, partial [Trichoderma pleuroticola]